MTEYSAVDLQRRLAALETAIAQFDTDAVCPWPVARIFNELLKHARAETGDDPVVKSIRFVEEVPNGDAVALSNVQIGSIRVLSAQIAITLERAAADPVPNGAADPPAGDEPDDHGATIAPRRPVPPSRVAP